MLVGVQINGFYQSVCEKTIKKERERKSFWGMEEGMCVWFGERNANNHECGKITA